MVRMRRFTHPVKIMSCKMSIKHYFANIRIAEIFALGKSADILQNICLNEHFQNLKKSYMRFFLSLRRITFRQFL